MNKGRKTTYEERIEIVNYCIANIKNYHETSKKFNVSYQQVYSWVKKFEKNGEESLRNRRGISKNEENLTMEEKYKLKLKKLDKKNERLRAEVALIKKINLIRNGEITQQDRYMAIKIVNEEAEFSIQMLCEIINLDRSSYYKWLNKKETKTYKENKIILENIKEIQEENNYIYGYRKMVIALNERLDISVNHKRVYKLMKENNLLSRRFKK